MAEKFDELSALAGQAAGLESAQEEAAAVGQGGAPVPPPQTNAQILAGAVHLAREASCIVLDVQSPRAVLDEATMQQLGEVWGAVADKRGWNLNQLMGDWGVEIAAVMTTVTIGMRLSKAVGAELEARERRPKPAPQPGTVDAG